MSVKIHVWSERPRFDLRLGRRLRGVWRLTFVCLYGLAAILAFAKSMPGMTAGRSGDGKPFSPWFEENVLVAHAGGGNAESFSYVNSLEAFERNYQLGHRVFEGDLSLTADGALVLEHDWEHYYRKLGLSYDGEDPTQEQFMASKFYGTDTPMDITALMELMLRHEDMYFMTDYKDCYEEDKVLSGFGQIVKTAKSMGCESVLDRFIIQNYHSDFKHWVESVYPFQNWVYTLYMLPEPLRTPKKIIRYCEKENIPVITMWTDWADEDWLSLTQPRNMKIFVHTENDPETGNRLLREGISGIYTDFLTEEQIETPG